MSEFYGCDEYIYSVVVGDIDNTGTGCSYYADYTATYSTIMEAGVSYDATVITGIESGTPYDGYYEDRVSIWVDWNQDGVFDDVTERYDTGQGAIVYNFTITPPLDAATGTTRMRVRLAFDMDPPACGSTQYGEVEDYTIEVIGKSAISGYKFDDTNSNGLWDTGESALPGWEIYIDENINGIHDASEPNVITDPNGYYEFSDLSAPAAYTICEVIQDGWTQTLPGGPDYGYTLSVDGGTVYPDNNFGNTEQVVSAVVSGKIIHDSNGDTIIDAGEPSLSDWMVYADTNGNTRYDPGEPNAITDINGEYQLVGLAPGSYIIAEQMQDGWVQTYPTAACTHTVTITTPDQMIENIDFGNHTFYGYGGGSGTLNDPYLIYNHLHLQAVGAHWWDWDKYFKLMDHIDLSKYIGEQFNMIGEYYFITGYNAFDGVFDGNGYTVYNFTYNYTDTAQIHVGLFGYVWHGDVRNLRMEDVDIYTQGSGVDSAALVGILDEGSTITNCHVALATVTVENWGAAGLIGWLRGGTVENCSVTQSDISGSSWSGGITGDNYEGAIYDCFFEGTVFGHQNVGGLVGDNQSIISRCYANAVVDGFQQVGGLSGGNSGDGIISECFSQGTVQTHTDPVYGLSGNEAGGLVGRNSDGDIIDCYSLADVSSVQKVGGFVATCSADSLYSCQITNCYAAGSVSGLSSVGGFIGWDVDDSTVINNCFWDTQTSGRTYSDGGTGLPTADMQTKQTYLDAGWDFTDETANGTDDIWQLCNDGSAYPGLAWDVTMPCGVSEIILYPTADAYVKSTEPDMNFGTSNSLTAGASGSTGAIYRSFLKFDMGQVPDGCRIVSARLELQANYLPFADVEVGAWFTTEYWDELDITWDNQVTSYDDLPTDAIIVSMDNNSWDVSEAADDRYVYDREMSIMLASTDESFAYYVGFWSSDLPLPDDSPRLIVQYEPIFGGGTGAADDPYQIWTAEQMNTIGLYSNRWDRSYKLMTDISMIDYQGSAYNQIGYSSSSPGTGFKGVFDGDGHTISDFNSGPLFNLVNWGRIQELGLIGPVVSGDGALVSQLEYSQVAECWVDGGSVNGSSDVGGLVGEAILSSFGGCWSSATVGGVSDVGGLIGSTSAFCQIENCYTTGDVSGQERVGGFIGFAPETVLTHCYSAGQVTGSTAVGGFCGEVEYFYQDPNIIIVDCFWDTVSSQQSTSAVGIGLDTSAMQDQSTFTTAGWDFVGETDNGLIDDWGMPDGGGYPVLWYQLTTAPPLPPFAGGTGVQGNPYQIATVEQFNSIGHNSRLLDKHFILMNDLNMSGQPLTIIANGPYAFMGSFDGNSHVIRNISISTPVFYSNVGLFGVIYSGKIFDLTLQNITIDAALCENVGSLVGMNRSGRIQNCHSQNADVYGQWSVGGLAGENYWYASISDCSVVGSVAENSFLGVLFSGVGGLVGENSWWSTIDSSGTNTDVSGEEMVGGLVGSNVIFADVTDSYATGTVTTTDDYAGGLAGRTAGGDFTHCYAACEITAPAEAIRTGCMAGSEQGGTYTNCFWNSQINDPLPGFGYTRESTVLIDTFGETTANMQTALTYQLAGWDFDTVWDMRCEAMSYPRLKSEPDLPGDFACPEGVEINDLLVLADEWVLAAGGLTADIAPEGGDGVVNILDYAAFAENWMLGVD